MADPTREDVMAALSRIAAPGGHGNLVSAGLVSGVAVNRGQAMVAIEADPSDARGFETLRQAAERAVAALPGIAKATVTLTAERAPGPKVAAAQQSRAGIPGIKHLIAVASGKGGVGKSTTAVNLALGLKDIGLSVAMLDADVYGPSVPRLLGLKGKPRLAEGSTKTMLPMTAFGLKAMSIGFLVEEDTPMIWRGPMVMSALMQMLRDVAWGEADVMVIDMPPGTGDAQLTLAQQTPLSGAVIVSTPQDLALIDARKGLAMFRRVNVPVLGIVENMSYFLCGRCGERHEIFGHGGARAEAERLGVPFLGEIPLDARLRERSDSGNPVSVTEPDSPLAQVYRAIATQVWGELSGGSGRKAAPRIVVEES